MASTSWRNRKTLILSRTDMMGLLSPAEYVDCVEMAFRRHGEGRCYLEPKGHIVLDKYPGEWEVMPSYIEAPMEGVTEAAACKWVSIRENNRAKFDLPTVFAEWERLAQDCVGWHRFATTPPFAIGKPFVRQPRVTPG